MRCLSTRGGEAVSLLQAITRGLAADGGLYVPALIPMLGSIVPRSIAEVAREVLAPYFTDELFDLAAACAAAFTFDAPLSPLSVLSSDDLLLELFHGPTAAFKDFGARFLAECLARQGSTERTVLVATSGDTGAAVAAAFADRPGFRVVVLYPDGRVSPRQAHQLGAFGTSVRAFRVAGSFDDCQAMAKAAFSDEPLRREIGLTSANSISLGRLLPQMAYYARAALEVADRGRGPASFVVPAGNLGNAMACLLARAMGLPIGRVVLATNANRVLVELIESGRYEPGASLPTLANAMDVGAPSNVERLRHLFPQLRDVGADSVDDDAIRASIRDTWTRRRVEICPHTACGVEVLRRLRARGATGTWIVAATAHAAKFDTVVEPLIGEVVPAPPALAEILRRPSHAEPLPASADALKAVLSP